MNTTISYGDARLARIFTREPLRCASVDEYAKACGMSTFEVLTALQDAISNQQLRLDNVAGTFYVHTAPNGRNTPGAHVPANAWEHLTGTYNAYEASSIWNLKNQLNRAGWLTETRPSILQSSFPGLRTPVKIGVISKDRLFPVHDYTKPETLAHPQGPLRDYSSAQIPLCVVLVPEGALEEHISAVRDFYLTNPHMATTTVLAQAPSFAPIVLRSDDVSVAPRAVTLEDLNNMFPG